MRDESWMVRRRKEKKKKEREGRCSFYSTVCCLSTVTSRQGIESTFPLSVLLFMVMVLCCLCVRVCASGVRSGPTDQRNGGGEWGGCVLGREGRRISISAQFFV